MTGTRAVGAVVIVLAVAAAAGPAGAVERNCPAGQIWNPSVGACVKKAVVRKRSPAESYYLAIDRLEGKQGKPDPAGAAALLGPACRRRHGPSCTLLGFLHEGGRLGKAEPARALGLYDRACQLDDADGCVAAAAVHSKGLLGQPEPAAAIAPLTRACDLGAGAGCVELAQKYEAALGVAHDQARAGKLYQRALERLGAECPKTGQSCYLLGVLHVRGKGVPADPAKARTAFTSGCQAGSGAACYAVGFMLQRGYGAAPDPEAALPFHDRACNQYDNADGCHDAGVILADRADVDPARLQALAARACRLSTAACDLEAYLHATGKAGDRDEAAATAGYLKACRAGNAVACSAAASRIAHGAGAAADGKLATQLWERACQTGSGADCYQAGVAHRDGELVAADRARAFELFELGCVRDSALACEDGAEMLLDDDGGGARDPEHAITMLTTGCKQGRGETCTVLGDLYRDGRGVEADADQALAAYRSACQADRPDGAACATMARLHAGGAGVTRDLAAAFLEHARACHLGEGTSCFVLDDLAREADADRANRDAAAGLLTAACDHPTRRVEDACLALAHSHAWGGALVERDPRAAVRLARASCQRGYRPACVLVADYQVAGVGVVAAVEPARETYTRMCDQDLPEACWKLGQLLVEAGRHGDAARLFQRACDEGLAAACNSVGYCLYTGRGAPWSVPEAARVYQRACELGDEYACANVGELHQFGIGTPVDLEQAAAAYRRSCDQVAVAGCARLAALIETGSGGETADPARARELYQRACDAQVSPEACVALAVSLAAADGAASEVARLRQLAFDMAMAQAEDNPYQAYVVGTFHRDGVAVARDPAAAARWFVESCEGRDPIGCMAAGEAYLAGDGVTRDRGQAVARFDRACAAGVEQACVRAAGARRGLAVNRRGCGCAGAGTGGGAGLALGVLGALLVPGRRRRRGRGKMGGGSAGRVSGRR